MLQYSIVLNERCACITMSCVSLSFPKSNNEDFADSSHCALYMRHSHRIKFFLSINNMIVLFVPIILYCTFLITPGKCLVWESVIYWRGLILNRFLRSSLFLSWSTIFIVSFNNSSYAQHLFKLIKSDLLISMILESPCLSVFSVFR